MTQKTGVPSKEGVFNRGSTFGRGFQQGFSAGVLTLEGVFNGDSTYGRGFNRGSEKRLFSNPIIA